MILRHTFEPVDNARLARLCGALDENLRIVEAAFDVIVKRRQGTFAVDGRKADAERAMQALQQMHERATRNVSAQTVQLIVTDVGSGSTQQRSERLPVASARVTPTDASPPAEAPVPTHGDIVLHTRKSDLRARTPNQRVYLRQMIDHDITFGIGPAGTGKTFLAVACAVDALERNQVQRIILTRPAVVAGARLGFLPGDLAQKVDPYLRPLYDALYDLMGFDQVTRAFDRGVLEIAPLAFMRGRTLNDAFVILDEAQNTTPEQMKMFLTRIGFGAKAVVTGDTSQVDLPKHILSGLIEAERVLAKVKGIAITRFTVADVVRHPLVARIVEAYERETERIAQAGA